MEPEFRSSLAPQYGSSSAAPRTCKQQTEQTLDEYHSTSSSRFSFVPFVARYCGEGAGAGTCRRRLFGRGGLRICRLPSFVTMTLVPSRIVMICEPSGKLRIMM